MRRTTVNWTVAALALLMAAPLAAQEATVVQPGEDIGEREFIVQCFNAVMRERDIGLQEVCDTLELYVNKSWTDLRHRTRTREEERCITAAPGFAYTGAPNLHTHFCRVGRCEVEGPEFRYDQTGRAAELCFFGKVWTQNNPGSGGPGHGKWEFCAYLTLAGEPLLPEPANDAFIRETLAECERIAGGGAP